MAQGDCEYTPWLRTVILTVPPSGSYGWGCRWSGMRIRGLNIAACGSVVRHMMCCSRKSARARDGRVIGWKSGSIITAAIS